MWFCLGIIWPLSTLWKSSEFLVDLSSFSVTFVFIIIMVKFLVNQWYIYFFHCRLHFRGGSNWENVRKPPFPLLPFLRDGFCDLASRSQKGVRPAQGFEELGASPGYCHTHHLPPCFSGTPGSNLRVSMWADTSVQIFLHSWYWVSVPSLTIIDQSCPSV